MFPLIEIRFPSVSAKVGRCKHMKKEWWLRWRSSGRGHKRGNQIIEELCRWQNCGPQFLTILSMYKNFKCNNKKKNNVCSQHGNTE